MYTQFTEKVAKTPSSKISRSEMKKKIMSTLDFCGSVLLIYFEMTITLGIYMVNAFVCHNNEL